VGGDEPHIDLPHVGRADALDFTVLNHAQELGLHAQRGLFHLVQKNRSTVGEFK
jgi:hypothetical protein